MRAILGSILDTAAVATSPDNFTQILRKLDNTGYSYLGRSYGVGAGVGFSRAINNTLETKEGLKSYEFTEWGYMVNISCSYDYNTNFTIHSPSSSDERPTYYHAKGFVDNGSYESVYMPGEDDSQVVAMLENPFHGRNVLAIATGKTAVNYQELNQTSCELFFNKHAFNVSVEHETRFISVSPLPPEQNPEEEDPEVLGERWMMLQNNTVRQMGAVVQVSGARFFTPLGNGAYTCLYYYPYKQQKDPFKPFPNSRTFSMQPYYQTSQIRKRDQTKVSSPHPPRKNSPFSASPLLLKRWSTPS